MMKMIFIKYFTVLLPPPYMPYFQISVPESFLITEVTVDMRFLNISDITWLNNKTEIKFPQSNNTYSIFSGDAPNNEFQSCILPNSNNTISHCRHLVHCVIPDILKSFEDFVPYGEPCVIDARFIGICCPPSRTVTTSPPTVTPPVTTFPPTVTTVA